MNKRYKYTARGMMLGRLWQGTKGAYPITAITADTREELLEIANRKLVNGTLNSGDFSELIGASLFIKAIEYIDVDGKTYQRDMQDPGAYIGDLTEEDQEFLDNAYAYAL